jgi:hypothetical protein
MSAIAATVGGRGSERPAAGDAGRLLWGSLLTLSLQLGTALGAQAQVFVSPFIAYDVGADTGCLNVLTCADRRVSAGADGGWMFGAVGVEEEIAYARDFFGAAPNLSSSVITVMTNGVFTRRIGRWHAYAVGGAGLLTTRVQFTQASFYQTDRKTLAWDVGGGLATYFGRHWGLRVDLQYFRSTRDVPLSGFTLSDSKLGFGRGSVGLIMRF